MPDQALLEVNDLDAFYGDFQALLGVTLRVEAGQAVAIIGANGAGKSTLVKSIAGLLRERRDRDALGGGATGRRAAEPVAGGRPAADGRAWACPHVQSEAHPGRRDQPRPRPDRGARHLRP